MSDFNRRKLFLLWFVSLTAYLTLAPSSTNAFPSEWREFGDRLRRYIINDHEVTVNVEWLTDEQLSELGTLDSPAQVAKIRQFYEQLVSSEERKEAANKIVTQCYDWLPEVTTEAERAELKRLHRVNHTECNTRIAEYISRLAEHRQKHLRRYWNFCEHVSNDTTRYVEHVEGEEILDEENDEELAATTVTNPVNHHQSRRHTFINPTRVRRNPHHHHSHSPLNDLEDCFTAHLCWLTDAQKDALRQMKASGKSEGEIQTKVFDFYDQSTDSVREKATDLLKELCVDVFKMIFGEEKFSTIKKMRESGSSTVEISTKVQEYFNSIDDSATKGKAKELGPHCQKLFTISGTSRRRRNAEHDHREHHGLDDYFNTHLAWLTEAQKNELRALKTEGKGFVEMKNKIEEYYAAADGEIKVKATEQLKAGCKELFKYIFGQEKLEEVRKMHESGTPIEEIATKIAAFKEDLKDDYKKGKAEQYGPHCKKLFLVSPLLRKRRDAEKFHNHDHNQYDNLEDYYKALSEAQKETLKNMKEDGKEFEDMKKIIDAFYKAETSETKTKDRKLFRGKCIELLKSLYGEEKYQQIIKMQRNGASSAEISAKIEEFKAALKDDKITKVEEYGRQCKSLLPTMILSRERRNLLRKIVDNNEYNSMSYPQNHLKWLSHEQIRQLKISYEEGADPVELQSQIFSMYTQITAEETMNKANLHLKRDCVNYFTSIVNRLLSKLARQQSKLSSNDILSILDQLLIEYNLHQQSSLWQLYNRECYRLFPTIKSKNNLERDIVVDQFRQAFDKYIKTDHYWLNEQQKMELNAFMNVNTDEERIQLFDKLFKFYKESEGLSKEKGEIQLKYACTEISVWFTTKLEAHLNALLSNNEMKHPTEDTIRTVNEMANQMRNARMSDLIRKSVDSCSPLLHRTKRQRRHANHHGAHTLQDYFKTHLAWLTNEQKDELLAAKSQGKSRAELQAKVMQFYSMTTGDTREKAIELLQAGCVELFKAIFGEEKYNEVKQMKENGTPVEGIAKKIDEFSATVENEHQKAQVKEYGDQCKTIFNITPGVAARLRRHVDGTEHFHTHGHHSLQDYFNTHLNWLTDVQKEELSTLKASGKDRATLYAKIGEYYETTTGETRIKAKNLLKSACEEMFTAVLGEEKLSEIQKLKTNGVTYQEIVSKIEGYLKEVTDEAKKTTAQVYLPHCNKLYAAESTRKRREIHNHEQAHQLEDYYKTHLSWLSDAQKAELKQLKTDGKGIKAMKAKIQEYYAETTGEKKIKATEHLKAGCIELFKHVFSEEKFEKVKQLKESGTSIDKISEIIDKFQAELTDPVKKAEIEEYGPHCKKLFSSPLQRKRRSVYRKKHRSLLDYFETHLSWLTESQKESILTHEFMGYPNKQLHKMIESYYEETTGDRRLHATRLLRSACAELFTAMFGTDFTADRLHKNGVSESQLNDYMLYCRRFNTANDEIDANSVKFSIQPQYPIPANSD